MLSGVAIVLLLLSFQAIADSVLSARELHPPAIDIGPLPACVPVRGALRINADATLSPGCNTVLFAPSSPVITSLLRRVAARAGLDYATHFVPMPGSSIGPPFDVRLVDALSSNASTCVIGGCGTGKSLSSSDCLPCALVRDNATLTEHLLAHPGGTQLVLWFLGAYAAPAVADLSYAVLFNYSVTVAPFNAPSRALELTRALQIALLESAADAMAPSGDSAASFNFTVALKSFPEPPPRVAGYDVFAANGGQWLFVVPALAFFHVLTELVHEKEARLRVGMRQMGLRTSAFWTSWVVYGAALCIVGTTVLQLSGAAARFDFYTNSDVIVTFSLFLSFSASMIALAVMLSTTMSSARTAQTIGYSFLLIGFLMQFVITSACESHTGGTRRRPCVLYQQYLDATHGRTQFTPPTPHPTTHPPTHTHTHCTLHTLSFRLRCGSNCSILRDGCCVVGRGPAVHVTVLPSLQLLKAVCGRRQPCGVIS